MSIRKSLSTYAVIFFTALLTFPSFAVETQTSANKHTLWKVSGTNASTSVYLLGSIHLLKQTDYPLDPALESAFTNSRVVAFETDMAKMEQLDTQLSLLAKAQLPEGQTLEGQLTPSTYLLFSNYVNKSGMPMMVFSQMKPFLAVMMLEVLELKKLGLEPEHGVDKYFSERVTKEGKRMVSLETVDFQINLITSFSKEENELITKTSLADMDKALKDFQDIIQAWKTGDSVKLEKFLNEATEQSPAIFKRLLTDRNDNWLPKIEQFISGKENTIVIVGAGHLVGKQGVVELLKKKGYRVTQL
jgi:uncharacterized protein YbaP (TraB family)